MSAWTSVRRRANQASPPPPGTPGRAQRGATLSHTGQLWRIRPRIGDPVMSHSEPHCATLGGAAATLLARMKTDRGMGVRGMRRGDKTRQRPGRRRRGRQDGRKCFWLSGTDRARNGGAPDLRIHRLEGERRLAEPQPLEHGRGLSGPRRRDRHEWRMGGANLSEGATLRWPGGSVPSGPLRDEAEGADLEVDARGVHRVEAQAGDEARPEAYGCQAPYSLYSCVFRIARHNAHKS